MDDLVSKLSEIRGEYNCFDEAEEPKYRALSTAIEAINAQRWIPCSERLPKNWSNILISDGDAVMEAFYVDGKFTGTCIYRGGEANVMEVSGVLAWMPLPEAYREDGDA